MTDDSRKLADSIRSGAYFNDARAWYQAIYIGPVSERTFFMIIAGLAGLIAIMAVMAMLSLVPIVTQAPIILTTRGEIDTFVPKITGLREGQQTVTDALRNFYLTEYVKAREGYSAASWSSSANLVHAQSDAATYATYVAQRNPQNPESIAAKLGKDGVLDVTITSVKARQDGNGGTATVKFVTQVQGAASATKTRWTAQLKYQYTDIAIDMASNEKTGESETKIKDPQFQVTGYAVEKNDEKN